MPRYDDPYMNTRLYVGHLACKTRSHDLDYIFSKFGRIRDVDMKRDYAFVLCLLAVVGLWCAYFGQEFNDARDADDARYHLDGKDVHGSRIIVEFAKGVPRGSREYLGRGPPPGSGRCFNCGIDGHWARDCKAGDWKNKCYRCGERGHIERNCKNSPKKLRRGSSYSRSPDRSPSPPRRGRSRSPSYRRSYSQSRSPPPKRQRGIDYERSRSPEPERHPRSRGRRHSFSPEDGDRARRISPEPYGSGRSDGSPRAMSPSPEGPAPGDRYASPQENGLSPSPRDPRHIPSSARLSPSPPSRHDDGPQRNRDNDDDDVDDHNGRSPSPRGQEDSSPRDDLNLDATHKDHDEEDGSLTPSPPHNRSRSNPYASPLHRDQNTPSPRDDYYGNNAQASPPA